jgi:tRNA modification GTPase
VLAAQGHGERLREGLVVAIAGPPNVGKSTLMNQLARREVAIVSPHAGTTRDVIEVLLDLDGYPVTVIDTAGIRETDDPVEQEGVRRARARAAEADLVLWLVDAHDEENFEKSLEQVAAPAWVVRNKIDLDAVGSDAAVLRIVALNPGQPIGVLEQTQRHADFEISASRGDGIQELIVALIAFAQNYFGAGEGGLITRERQRKLLQETAAALQRSLSAIQEGEELAAEDLRIAARSLGRLLGRVDVEDVLDVIFREFCIGK